MLDKDLLELFPGPPGASAGQGPALLPREGVLDGDVREVLARLLAGYLNDRSHLGYDRLVVGLSGGVDSVVCAQLAWDAAPGAVNAVIIDMGDGVDGDETEFAVQLAESIGIPHVVLDGRSTYAAHRQIVQERRVISRIHMRSRLLTSMIFQVADNLGGLVVDTTDKSEVILRLYEEGQRGHVAPIIDLYKSELYAMATEMGLGVVSGRASGCPDLNNFDAFGMEWGPLDAVLRELAELRSPPDEIAQRYDLDLAWLNRLERRIRTQPLRTAHVRLSARTPPEAPGLRRDDSR